MLVARHTDNNMHRPILGIVRASRSVCACEVARHLTGTLVVVEVTKETDVDVELRL